MHQNHDVSVVSDTNRTRFREIAKHKQVKLQHTVKIMIRAPQRARGHTILDAPAVARKLGGSELTTLQQKRMRTDFFMCVYVVKEQDGKRDNRR